MHSMTGFGVARGRIDRSHVVIEARSVNHRFCEVNLRFPGRFAVLEPEVMKLVRRRFARGKFDFFLREEVVAPEDQEVALAKRSHRILSKIQHELGLKEPPVLGDVLAFRGILFSHAPAHDVEAIREPLIKLVETALTGLKKMRTREGASLKKWMEQNASKLLRLLKSIEKHSALRGLDYRKRLEGRLKGMGTVEEERVIKEAAIMAERADVTEEIVRLKSHIQELVKFIRENEPIGRKLDFLAQEMGREINTIGSKVQGVQLSHDVIEFKSELEKIREQIQNIE